MCSCTFGFGVWFVGFFFSPQLSAELWNGIYVKKEEFCYIWTS